MKKKLIFYLSLILFWFMNLFFQGVLATGGSGGTGGMGGTSGLTGGGANAETNIVGNREPSTFNGKSNGFTEYETNLPGTNNSITGSRVPGQTNICVTDSTTKINGKVVPPGNYYQKRVIRFNLALITSLCDG